ncbi:M23 family metallopeptidase [Aliiglaciecola litoralis]|uniref:M23 family metallopeptidase n=1 Tax=Aliiglaciecola litoralis TaxID=582857 RepID=A0ABP3WRY3_9ALTE
MRGLIWILLLLMGLGLMLPETPTIPVQGATAADWNHKTFWHAPWGTSGVHKGIDIFTVKRTPVLSSTYGLVVKVGSDEKGGNIVWVLGPKWKLHYYAHLDDYKVNEGQWIMSGDQIGTVGTSGNAGNRPPHLHYAIYSLVPIPWRYDIDQQGWKKMFVLNPHEALNR